MLEWLTKSVWRILALVVGVSILVGGCMIVFAVTGTRLLWPRMIEVPGPTQIVTKEVEVVRTQMVVVTQEVIVTQMVQTTPMPEVVQSTPMLGNKDNIPMR